MGGRQFGLKAVFASVSLVAVLAAGVFWWQWWTTTRHMRNLGNAIAESALDANTKEILTKLAWTPEAWQSGLIRDLVGPVSAKQIVWRGKTKDTHDPCEVYLFDAFVRPVADSPIPPVCVILERQRNLRAWSTVATYSSGFLSAALDDRNVLTVTTVSNWFYGQGRYRYAIGAKSIVPLGEGVFTKFENDPTPIISPQFGPPTPEIDEATNEYFD